MQKLLGNCVLRKSKPSFVTEILKGMPRWQANCSLLQSEVAIDFSHSLAKREPCLQILLPHITTCSRMHSNNIGLASWTRQRSGIVKSFPPSLATRTACTCLGWLRFNEGMPS